MNTDTKIIPNLILPDTYLFMWGMGDGNPTNWKALIDTEIPCNNKIVREMASMINNKLKRLRVQKTILAPNTIAFNAQICDPENLGQRIELKAEGITFLRGYNAEGVILPKGQVAGFFPADCNTIIARGSSGRMIVAHAGSFSLIDLKAIIEGERKARPYGSVVTAMVAKFKALGDKPQDITVYIVRGIRAQEFGYHPEDPTFGDRNKKIIEAFQKIGEKVVPNSQTGGVDITLAIRLQLEALGVPKENISEDDTNTWNDRNNAGGYKWWSHGRVEGTSATDGRNLVLVVHT